MRLAIFDADGTLVDSFPWFCSVLNEAAVRHGFRPVSESERQALRLLSTRDILKSLRVPLWKGPAIARDMRALKLAADIGVFDGTETALRALAAEGVRLAVVSSDSEASIRRTLGPDFSALFERIDGGSSLFGKAGKLKKALAAAGVPASEAVYVGDETRDAEAACTAGLRFAAVTWGYAAREALIASKPDAVIDHVGDLARLAARV